MISHPHVVANGDLPSTNPWLAQLPTTIESLQDMLEAPDAQRRVQQLPSVLLHQMICNIGVEDCTELLALATSDQVKEILDLELWDGEQLKTKDAMHWLHLMLVSLPDEVRQTHLSALDEELLGLTLLSHMNIHVIESEDDDLPEPEGVGYQTPDGLFFLDIHAPTPEEAESIISVVDRLYRDDYEFARSILQSLQWSLPSDLEEWSLRWRNSRMQDLGFADYEEAMKLYAYLDPESVRADEQTAEAARLFSPSDNGSPDAVMALPHWSSTSFWNRALDLIDEQSEQDRLSAGLMLLSNRCLSADKISSGDLAKAQESLERLHWRLSLGLEYLCRGDVALAPAILKHVALLRIARLGHSLLLRLQRHLLPLARDKKLGTKSGLANYLDEPLRLRIEALLASKPLYYDEQTTQSRPPHNLLELSQVEHWVQEAQMTVELLSNIGFPQPLPERVTYGDVFRTRLINRLLGRDEFEPLDERALAEFIQKVRVNNDFWSKVGFAAAELAQQNPKYKELLDQWCLMLQTLIAELPDKSDQLDLRFIEGLWLEDQDRI